MIVEEIGRGLRAWCCCWAQVMCIAPFPLHALPLVRCVGFLWTLRDVVTAASASSLGFSGLFLAPAERSGRCRQGEFTCSGVCLDGLLLMDVC